jgi:dipeptidyl-peptidase-4
MHSLNLIEKLSLHGQFHKFVPLPGVSHMTPQEVITEDLLRMQLEFFKTNLNN